MAKTRDASLLKAQLGKMINTFGSGVDDDEADPFNMPNDFEDAARKGQSKAPAVSKSRRAQQEAKAKAAKAAAEPAEPVPARAAGSRLSTDRAVSEPDALPVKAGKAKLPACAEWWLEVPAPAADALPVDATRADDLRARGMALYEAETKAFTASQHRKHGSDHRMMQKLVSAGTIKDRVAALTVQAQESAFHALPAARQLLALTERPARDVKMAASEALAELFISRLLPPRALVPLERSRLPAEPTDAQLLHAHFEDALKATYAAFTDAVVAATNDSVLHVKQVMIGRLYALLAGKPELERKLLPALVNKLGDPEKKVASRLTHLLNSLMQQHPAMKPVVLAEIQRFVLRPNVSHRSQYYAVVLLNQLILTSAQPPRNRRATAAQPPRESAATATLPTQRVLTRVWPLRGTFDSCGRCGARRVTACGPPPRPPARESSFPSLPRRI